MALCVLLENAQAAVPCSYDMYWIDLLRVCYLYPSLPRIILTIVCVYVCVTKMLINIDEGLNLSESS